MKEKPLVLIVDDQRTNRDLFKLLLSYEGYSCISAASGEEAISMISRHQPDLILLDVVMPGGLDGFETCLQIRERDDWKAIPIIVVTSLSDRGEKLKALQCGAQDFICKPIDEVELSTRIRSLLKTKHLYDILEKRNEDLLSTTSRLVSLVDNLHEGIIFEDASRRIIYVNQEFCDMFSISISQKDLISEESQKIFNMLAKVIMDDSYKKDLEFLLHKNEAKKNIEWKLQNGKTVLCDYIPISVAGEQKGYLWKYRDISDLKRAREKEAEIGFKIQGSLLLEALPEKIEGVNISALTIPSEQIDGDFYDFFVHNKLCFDIILGDVLGKGIPAALVGAGVKQQFLRAMNQLLLKQKKPFPENLVNLVHQTMTKELIELDKFVTICYARFDLESHLLNFVDCGHTKTIHFKKSKKICLELSGQGLPIGVKEDEVYRQETVMFSPGDLFFFYSDGVTEGMNREKELFGTQRLCDCIRKNHELTPKDLIEKIRLEVINFTGSQQFADDMTCIAIEIESKKLTSTEVFYSSIFDSPKGRL